MVSCDKVIESIWEYLDKEMTPDAVIILQKHVELCRSCFTRFEFERALRENCKTKTNHCCPDKLKARIRQIIDLY
jgi:anti-sigma factor (TIGR02949 family)